MCLFRICTGSGRPSTNMCTKDCGHQELPARAQNEKSSKMSLVTTARMGQAQATDCSAHPASQGPPRNPTRCAATPNARERSVPAALHCLTTLCAPHRQKPVGVAPAGWESCRAELGRCRALNPPGEAAQGLWLFNGGPFRCVTRCGRAERAFSGASGEAWARAPWGLCGRHKGGIPPQPCPGRVSRRWWVLRVLLPTLGCAPR
jgi:hypothetical protein